LKEKQGHYKITWLTNAVKAENNPHILAVGVCEYSKRIAFVTDSNDILTLLCVHDLYITAGKCEEGRWCLCKSCPYNKTTASSLSASSPRWRGTKSHQLETLHKMMAEFERILKEKIESIDWSEKQIILEFEKVPIKVKRPE
jgi:hypothetical protein